MLVIALTGGIGSGKTTVANLFADLGVPVVDADIIARELVEPGQPALQKIAKTFGSSALDENGRLKRIWLRHHIFSDPVKRRSLEEILHPLIYQEIRVRVQMLEDVYCIVSIPLLLETGQKNLFDRILVVDARDDVRIRRVMERDGMDKDEVQAIINTQLDRESRLAGADDVISNDSDLLSLEAEVLKFHQKYQHLA